MIKIAVGSTNPVKIKSVSLAFTKVWPHHHFDVQGVSVSSGVPSQPLSDTESIQGALNRARTAQKLLAADYGVGLEGGLQLIEKLWFNCGWMAVIDKQGIVGLGSTARIITPPPMVDMIKKGTELGSVVDHFFGTKNAKQGVGHFGLMTNQAITRESGYTDGVIMALVRFLHPELF